MKQKIAVYDGPGASPSLRPGFISLNPRFLKAEDILGGALDSQEILIMPGGRDVPYHAALRGPGNAKIRSFVEKGGTYIGICAGAYYGAAKVVFDPGHPLQVCEDRELGFFSGSAIGPAFGFGTFEYQSYRGARAVLLEFKDRPPFRAFYYGGCYFEGDLSKCEILARYGELPNKPPAILSCPVGRGTAILSGVHLETPAEILAGIDFLFPLLQASENIRREYWTNILLN